MLDLLTAPPIGSWWLLSAGLLLIAAEMATGGFFVLGFGVAAIVVGLIAFVLPLYWWAQIALIGLIAPFVIIATRRWQQARQDAEGPSMINRRSAALSGRRFPLHSAILGGHGEIFADDTRWDVTGPDLPAGTMVKVTGGSDASLTVEAA